MKSGDRNDGAVTGVGAAELNSPRLGSELFAVGIPAFCAFNRALPAPRIGFSTLVSSRPMLIVSPDSEYVAQLSSIYSYPKSCAVVA